MFNPGDIIEVNRSRTILFFTDDWEVIAKEALTLFVSMLIPPSEVSSTQLFPSAAPFHLKLIVCAF